MVAADADGDGSGGGLVDGLDVFACEEGEPSGRGFFAGWEVGLVEDDGVRGDGVEELGEGGEVGGVPAFDDDVGVEVWGRGAEEVFFGDEACVAGEEDAGGEAFEEEDGAGIVLRAGEPAGRREEDVEGSVGVEGDGGTGGERFAVWAADGAEG